MAKIFIDCGGHRGQSVGVFLKKPDAKEFIIHSFEPDGRLWKYHEGLPTVLHKEAVWTHDGKINFYLAKQSQGSTVVEGKLSAHIHYGKPVIVPCIDFSSWIKQFKNDYVIVKMNIEGAEYAVLNKMLEDDTAKIMNELYIEFHAKKIRTIKYAENKRLCQALTSQGVEVKDWKLKL